MEYSNEPQPYFALPEGADYTDYLNSSDDELDASGIAEYEAIKASREEHKREIERNMAPWKADGRGNHLTLRQRNEWYRSVLGSVGLGYASGDVEEQEIISLVGDSDDEFRVRKDLWGEVVGSGPESVDPMGDWPARLLNVATMASVEWQPGNVYDGVREPRYAIISYTWGRWKLDDDAPGDPLPVSGVPWKVPRVDQELFTVEEFQKVLNAIARDSDTTFVWVDIACIDQTPGSLENAREVGRQAKIFGNAHGAYIWLVKGYRYDRDVRDILYDLQDLECTFSKATSPPEPDPECPLTAAAIDEWTFASGVDSLVKVLNLPWFTSLWTLQEGFLRTSAKFIVGCDYAMSENGYCIALQDLLTWCIRIHELIPPALPMRTDAQWGSSFVDIIYQYGIDSLARRDRLSLYFAAKSRTTSDPLDRIYAIMQVWDFALGKSAPSSDPSRTWTLPELETELGKALLQEFPIESQLHVRLSPSETRQAWRISPRSSGIYHDLEFLETGRLAGTMDRRGSSLGLRQADGVVYAHFVGKACPFRTFLASWKELEDAHNYGSNENGPTPHQSPPVRLVLDKTPLGYGPLGGTQSEVRVPAHELLSYAARLYSHLRELQRNASVLLLGTISQRGGASWVAVGLLVMNAPDDVIGGWQKRLGLVMWTSWSHTGRDSCYKEACDVMSTDSGCWEDFECIIG